MLQGKKYSSSSSPVVKLQCPATQKISIIISKHISISSRRDPFETTIEPNTQDNNVDWAPDKHQFVMFPERLH